MEVLRDSNIYGKLGYAIHSILLEGKSRTAFNQLAGGPSWSILLPCPCYFGDWYGHVAGELIKHHTIELIIRLEYHNYFHADRDFSMLHLMMFQISLEYCVFTLYEIQSQLDGR